MKPLLENLDLMAHVHHELADPTTMGSLFRATMRAAEDHADGFRERASQLLYGVLLEMTRAKSRQYPPSIQDALAFMADNVGRRVALSDLVERAGTSREHFCDLVVHVEDSRGVLGPCIGEISR